MINSINSSAAMPPPPRKEQSLTSDQQSVISDTLSEFDVDNLSETDALSIVAAFSEAGIQPGLALEKAVSNPLCLPRDHEGAQPLIRWDVRRRDGRGQHARCG